MATTKPLPPCEFCGKKDFYSAATRGTHLRFIHGIQGLSRNAKGRKTHKSVPAAAKKISQPIKRKVKAHEAAIETANIEDLQLGYVVGRVTQLIESHALAFGVAARELTGYVAEALRPTPRG